MLSAIAVLVAYGTMLTGLRPFPLLTEILTHYSKLIFTISAPPEILINQKSDLRRGEEGLLHEEHKRWRIVVNGGLLLSRKERAMIITLSEQIILTANQPRSGTHHFSARASVQTSDSVDAVEGRFVPRADLINIKVRSSRGQSMVGY